MPRSRPSHRSAAATPRPLRLCLAVAAALALLVTLLPAAPLGASEPEEGEVVVEHTDVYEEPGWRAAGSGAGMGLWFWPEGGRVFQQRGVASFVAYDAVTGQVRGTVDKLSPPVWGDRAQSERVSSWGRHHVAAVDRGHGRLFVAYETVGARVGGTTEVGALDVAAGREAPCSTVKGGIDFVGCVGGIHVVDGEAMESLGRIRLDLPTVEGPRAQSVLRALEWAPADEARGWGGRVLMLVEEGQPNAAGQTNSTSLASTQGRPMPGRRGGNIVYAVAFDPNGMRQDWVVRVEACRNTREPDAWMLSPEGHPATLFRVGGDDPALYVGCHATSQQQGAVVRIPLDDDGMPAGMPVRAGDPGAVTSPDADGETVAGVVAPSPRQEVFPGPDNVMVILSDPASRRILMRVDDAGQVWWVFDGHANQFLGTIGIGGYQGGQTTYGLDEDTGRLYVAAARSLTSPGGLYVADARRNPLPQALHYTHLETFAGSPQLPTNNSGSHGMGWAMSVQPRAGGDRARVFVTRDQDSGQAFRVIVDASPVSVDPDPDEGVVRTLDIAEADGVTEATFDGTARGFGFRAILLGGVEGAARLGPADPVGWVRGVPEHEGGSDADVGGTGQALTGEGLNMGTLEKVTGRLPRDPCLDAQRELVVAFVGPEGPAVVDASSSRGEAQPVLADVRTREDAGAPVTRCGPADWPELWRTAMVSQPPASEPGVAWPFDDSRSSCTATDQEDKDSWSDPVAGAFSSRVDCSEDEVGGWGQARGLNVDGVSVASTLSSFRIYRDPQRGLVARVESVARGIDLGGVVRIDTIRGVAESWANGRRAGGFHDPALERELGLAGDDEEPIDDDEGSDSGDAATGDAGEWNPWNCDTDRPAGTCFERHVFGVTVTDPASGEVWRCGPCGPEEDFVEAMNRVFGAHGLARFREPDPALARGSEDGYVAAVTKKDSERFADIVLNADLLETMVPMLEVIRYAPHNRIDNPDYTSGGRPTALYFNTGNPPRGRQVYQFAAVEVSSTYSIQCLLEYVAATNVCAAPEVPASSLTVELVDGEGAPLAGGAFELRQDTDGDGVLGLVDEVVEGGACATGPEGACAFGGLEPGSYLVSQTAAPDGYAPVDEPLAVSLFGGDDLTVTFTNVPNVSTISLTVTDLDGNPVAGAVFWVFPDADHFATASASASASTGGVEPVATCTTDADGVCAMSVPPGAYVLRQLAAPEGLLPIDDIAFVISQAGQTADVALTLGAAGTDPAPVTEPAAGPVDDFAPAPAPLAQPAVSIAPAPARTAPSVTATPPAMAAPPPAIAEQVGGTVIRVIRSPANALRLAARSPIEAASLVMVLLLVGLAAMAVTRRQQLATLLAGPGHEKPAGGPGTGGPAAPTAHAATAVLERPTVRERPRVVAGAAPSPTERVSATVVVATAFPALAALLTQKLGAAERCELRAAADSLDDLRAALDRHAPDVLVVDLVLPTGDDPNAPTDLCDVLAELHPAEHTVGLVPPNESFARLVARGHEAGLGGLLVTDNDLGNGNLAFTVRQVAVGHRCYGPKAQTVLIDSVAPTATTPVSESDSDADSPYLTERELEIARLAAKGLRREIAKRLVISDKTVKTHLANARRKLGIDDNPRDYRALRRRLEEHGLLDDELGD